MGGFPTHTKNLKLNNKDINNSIKKSPRHLTDTLLKKIIDGK